MKGILLKLITRILFWRKRVEGKLNKRQSGVTKDCEDSRDFDAGLHLGTVRPPMNLTLNINPLDYVKNQGMWNSCVSHAMVTSIEILHDLDNTNLSGIELSERYHYFYGRHLQQNYPDNGGMYLRNAMKAAQQFGASPERLCPYVSNKMNDPPDVFSVGFGQWYSIGPYFRIYSLETLKGTLTKGFPVVVSLRVNNSLRASKGDVVVVPGENIYGAHAVVVYGFDDKGFMCINSWGKEYKDNGTMRVPYDYFEKYGLDYWMFNL